MSNGISNEAMLEMFIFETNQLLDQLEQSMINSEELNGFETSMNEIFRTMHTIKGCASMMYYDQIALLAHSVEDLFYFIRQENPNDLDYRKLTDIILEAVDFIKIEIAKLESGKCSDGDASNLIDMIQKYLYSLQKSDPQNLYTAIVHFEQGCEMENIRAYTIIHNLTEIAEVIAFYPEDIVENNKTADFIKEQGFKIEFKSECSIEEIQNFFSRIIYLKEFELDITKNTEGISDLKDDSRIELNEIDREWSDGHKNNNRDKDSDTIHSKQSMISVSIPKLDKLMDLVGEMVIAEALVTQNPELEGLPLSGFHKAARQLQKITSELQDIAMSIRMVPLSITFQKMNRIVRDMSKRLEKQVYLEIIGEETEVDKNIIEQISDPLMHLIRNSIDHGIETVKERKEKGKPQAGKITLEARNAGGDVWIIIKDDGKGLDREKILRKALGNGLVTKDKNDLTDKEIYSFILLPGFSTKDEITEFSGRGVGMDVVMKNMEKIRGTVSVDSIPDVGTTISIKIPLTLAIIGGMNIKVGKSRYTIPITAIKESFRVDKKDIIKDTCENEMILIRGQCYPVLRLHEIYKIETEITEIHEGIITLVEEGDKGSCIFSDALIGEQQVVVKSLPEYIKKVRGVAGCTLLGDGGISLILNISDLL